jgi:hypothetical protein
MSKFVKIIIFVPVESADKIRKVLGDNGAGRLGDYSHSSFSTKGKGRFKPEKGADPAIGEVGKFEETDEERIEVIAPIEKYLEIVEKVKKSHPYEEPAIEVYDLLYP